jgi:hypothetical protein
METIELLPLPIQQWLPTIEREYFQDYLPAGGCAIKFAVANEDIVAAVAAGVTGLAHKHDMLTAHADAGRTRLHMLQDVFFALARWLPWEKLAQSYIEDLFTRNDYPWPKPGETLTQADLATHFATAPNLLARSRDQWLSQDLWNDALMAQDFRAAMMQLCLSRLEPGADGPVDESPVLRWLYGEKVPAAALRQHDIGARIGRTNARAMLISLCHWVRKVGKPGLLLTLDLRPALRTRPNTDGLVRYTPAAVMDLYEVLRELVDDIEHLPGLFVLVLADQALISGEAKRTLDCYKALEMRIWPDVRPGDRQNPVAPLVMVCE